MRKRFVKRYQCNILVDDHKFTIQCATKSKLLKLNEPAFEKLDFHVKNIALTAMSLLVQIESPIQVLSESKEISKYQISCLTDLEDTVKEALDFCFDGTIENECAIHDAIPSGLRAYLYEEIEFGLTTEELEPYQRLVNKLLENRISSISTITLHLARLIVKSEFSSIISDEEKLNYVGREPRLLNR